MGNREVAILGVGLHKFGSFPEKSLGHMAAEAGMMALRDAGMGPADIQYGFAAHVYLPIGTGTQVFGAMGITGIPISVTELACASSSRAVLLAAMAILSGEVDTCMVIGIEKMAPGLITLAGMDRASVCHEALFGITTAPSMYGLLAVRHMATYGSKPEHFAKVAEIDKRNACLNPYAQFHKPMSLEDIMGSEMMAYPVTKFQCSAPGHGASAVVLCSKEKARQYTTNPVYLAGWDSGSPYQKPGNPRLDISDGDLPGMARKAYEMAGVGPEDVDVAQSHDAFSPGMIFDVEELGFCPEGEGGRFIWEGNTEIGGKIPINTDGGLLGRGHPLGATGGAMIAELVYQLRGQAGPRQVKDGKAKVGMLHNAGGGGGQVMVVKR